MTLDARSLAGVLGLALLMALVQCARDPEQRQVAAPRPPTGERPSVVFQVPLRPGPAVDRPRVANPYEGDGQALEEGHRLYEWFNCSGCHFGGGGGIGPPLSGVEWIYGGDPDQLFDSIAAGRANGMPAYGGLLTSEQIWKIVLYVESIDLGPAGRPQEPAVEDLWSDER